MDKRLPGSLRLRGYQIAGVAHLASWNYRAFLADEMGIGKAVALTAGVLTPSGWVPIGSLKVGDAVIDPDGGHATVQGVFPQGLRQMYRVAFKDGTSVECDEEHLWHVHGRSGEDRVLTLAEIVKLGCGQWAIPVMQPAEYAPGALLDGDPYRIGVEVAFGIRRNIPVACLTATISARIALLHGLMDTEGAVTSKGDCIFDAPTRFQHECFVDLVRGLGGIVSASRRGRAYRSNVRLPFNPFKYHSEARNAWVPPASPLTRAIESVTATTVQEAVCIKVDSKRSLFVTDNYTVTHNTVQVIAAILYAPHRLLPAVVSAPKSVEAQWARELARWAPGLNVCRLRNGKASVPEGFAGVILTTHGLLEALEVELLAAKPRLLILDEAHEFKNPDAQRTIAARKLAAKIPAVIPMTGTPVRNNEDEFIELLKLIGRNEQPGERERVLRRTAADVPGALPPLSWMDLPIEPTAEFLSGYSEIEEKARDAVHAGLDGREVRSRLAACLQFTSKEKIPHVVEFLQNGDAPKTLVFCKHPATAGAMVRALEDADITAFALTGQIAPGVKNEMTAAFNNEADPRVLVCTETMKQGVNLPAARYVVQLERYWVPADEQQAAGRARRADSKHAVTVVAPRIEGTIDDRIAAALTGKEKTAQSVAAMLSNLMVDDEQAHKLTGEGTEFVPHWARPQAAGSATLSASETPVACLFDLQRWSAEEITAWCAINGYPVLDARKTSPRYLLVQTRPRDRTALLRGVKFVRKVLRAGVLGFVPSPESQGG